MALKVMRVGSVAEAAKLVAGDGGARIAAGGTLVVRDYTAGDVGITSLVLTDGLGMDGIAIGGKTVTIGAAATMAKIAANPSLGFLKPVALSIGGPAVRAMATAGGNLLAPYPYGDFAVALLALGATVTLETGKGSETVDLGAFLSKRRGGRDGVIVQFSFARPQDGTFRFAKVIRRKPHGASVLSIAAVLPATGGKISGARVAYGAMAERPMRAAAVEAALNGKALDAASIAAAVKVATDGTSPLTDPQASAWYRTAVLPVHLKRLLEG
jgi:CO/xanthine dehydrogenase FAD-binding subunit